MSASSVRLPRDIRKDSFVRFEKKHLSSFPILSAEKPKFLLFHAKSLGFINLCCISVASYSQQIQNWLIILDDLTVQENYTKGLLAAKEAVTQGFKERQEMFRMNVHKKLKESINMSTLIMVIKYYICILNKRRERRLGRRKYKQKRKFLNR